VKRTSRNVAVLLTLAAAARSLVPGFALSSPVAPNRIATDDGTWSPAPTLSGRSYVGAFVYDPVRDRLLLFGGNTDLNDLWSYSITQKRWTRVSTTGTPPPAVSGAAGFYDPVRDRVVVF